MKATRKSVPPRQRLHSLRLLAITSQDSQHATAHLERCLNRDNLLEKQDAQEPSIVLPGFESAPVEDKLWRYFLSRIGDLQSKVEKEQVNSWTKEMNAISKEVLKKIETNKSNLKGLKELLEGKYRQIHAVFQQIKREKAGMFVAPPNNAKPKQRETHGSSEKVEMLRNSEKTEMLRNNIEQLRRQIEALSNQEATIQKDLEKIELEYRSLLVNLLKGGYYRNDGVQWILEQMAYMRYRPAPEDFPPMLTPLARQYLFSIHSNMSRKEGDNKRKKSVAADAGMSLKGTMSSYDVSSFLHPQKLKDVYKNARSLMADLLKQPSWKESKKVSLPEISKKTSLKQKDTRRQNEEDEYGFNCRRVLQCYTDEDMRRRVSRILFGWRVDRA